MVAHHRGRSPSRRRRCKPSTPATVSRNSGTPMRFAYSRRPRPRSRAVLRGACNSRCGLLLGVVGIAIVGRSGRADRRRRPKPLPMPLRRRLRSRRRNRRRSSSVRSRRHEIEDALTVLRAERTRVTAVRVRSAVWRMVGASEGETLADVLRRPQANDPVPARAAGRAGTQRLHLRRRSACCHRRCVCRARAATRRRSHDTGSHARPICARHSPRRSSVKRASSRHCCWRCSPTGTFYSRGRRV